MKTLYFKNKPTFAELWDACLYNLLYNEKEYTEEILSLFNSLDLNTRSKMIDTSAGTGFIALHLRQKGFDIDCMDLMQDEIDVFQEKAKEMNVDNSISKLAWLDMFNFFEKESYDFVFCRGNSFVFAPGGWNETQEVDQKRCLEEYKKTLKIFYDAMKPGAYLYLDKFKDGEIPHRDTVANVKIEGEEPKDLVFYTEIKSDIKERSAAMLLVDENGNEQGLPNQMYLLESHEVESMLKEVGFTFNKINFKSDQMFDIWLCQK